jgi:hypothetical protein
MDLKNNAQYNHLDRLFYLSQIAQATHFNDEFIFKQQPMSYQLDKVYYQILLNKLG